MKTETKYCWEIGMTTGHAVCVKHTLTRETDLCVFVKTGTGERRIKKHSCGWTIKTDRGEAMDYYGQLLRSEIESCDRRIKKNKESLENRGLSL